MWPTWGPVDKHICLHTKILQDDSKIPKVEDKIDPTVGSYCNETMQASS